MTPTPGTEIIETPKAETLPRGFNPNRDQLDLLKQTIAKDTTDDEFSLFIEVCKHKGLDPFAKQIYCIKRYDQEAGKYVMTIQTGIDGFRLQAERSGKYAGQTPPEWCDASGRWLPVWLADTPPAAARVGVYRKDFQAPLYSIAVFKEYAPRYKRKEGGFDLVPMWKRMPANQLIKCAEAGALRKAFPDECGGMYVPEEMHRQDVDGGAPLMQPGPLVTPPAQPEKNAYKVMLDAFAALKSEIGEELYYKVLAARGLKHSNQIRSRELARQIYNEMKAAGVAAAAPAPEPAAPVPETPATPAADEWEVWDRSGEQQ
jgi:phage recombination protein Bet